jgi:dissimilatory sulfite reductase (desulfoviridin) alpha/beta subunit
VKACPTGAAGIAGKKAAINNKLCIRCMCCHEVCRFNAIYPGRPVFGAVLHGVLSAARRM